MKSFTASISSLDAIEITLISEGVEFERQGTCFVCKNIEEELYTFITSSDSSVKLAYSDVEEKATKHKEVFHAQFDKLVALFEMGEHIFGVGPAGTGKSNIAKQLADFFHLDFYPDSTLFSLFDLVGFVDANGKFHETNFYKAFKYGGVHLLDEFEGSPEDVPLKLNSALANGWITFPNGETVTMHKNYRCFATGNTMGKGADEQYTGRHALDAATLDRFQPIWIDYDYNIEMAIAEYDEDLVKFIEDFRQAVKACNINHLVTYRELKRLVKFSKKFELTDAIEMALKADIHSLGDDNRKAIYFQLKDTNKYSEAFNKLCFDENNSYSENIRREV